MDIKHSWWTSIFTSTSGALFLTTYKNRSSRSGKETGTTIKRAWTLRMVFSSKTSDTSQVSNNTFWLKTSNKPSSSRYGIKPTSSTLPRTTLRAFWIILNSISFSLKGFKLCPLSSPSNSEKRNISLTRPNKPSASVLSSSWLIPWESILFWINQTR